MSTDKHAGVRYPWMRLQITAALESMSDIVYQKRVWLDRIYPDEKYYDDFDLAFHILFDDTEVCSEPDEAVGDLIYEDEAESFRALGAAIGDILDDESLIEDADYMADRRWPGIVHLAQVALHRVQQNGDGFGPNNDDWGKEPPTL